MGNVKHPNALEKLLSVYVLGIVGGPLVGCLTCLKGEAKMSSLQKPDEELGHSDIIKEYIRKRLRTHTGLEPPSCLP